MKVNMRILFINGMAFMEINKGYLLCVGTQYQVEIATEDQLADMIAEAIIQKSFQEVDVQKHTVH